MKKLLLLITSFLFLALVSCQEDKDEPAISMNNALFGIEQITINETSYPLMENSLFIDKGKNSPLLLVGNSYSSNSVGLDYVWMSQTEKLTFAGITSKKGQVSVSQTKTSTTITYILTVSTTSPKAKMTYTISAHL